MESIGLTYIQFPYVILPQIELLGYFWTPALASWLWSTAELYQRRTDNDEYLMEAPQCNTGIYCIVLTFEAGVFKLKALSKL